MAYESPASGSGSMPPVKILWLNPANTTAYDQPIADLIKEMKLPNAEVHIASLSLPPHFNLTNLEFRVFESAITFPVTHIAHWASQQGFDGYVIGCFYDTALDEAREASSHTIVGAPCDAALKIVSRLANRWSVIIGVEKWKVQMEDRIRYYGFSQNLASFRSIGMRVPTMQEDVVRTEEAIRTAVKDAIEIDKAEAIVLGCTIEFGYYRKLQEEFGVPVVDAVAAAYKDTEHAALLKKQFGWGPSRVYSMAPPGEDELAESGVFGGEVPIGNTIVVPRTE